MTSSPDVLVVGGGPGGASAAYWLARDGVSTVAVEKKSFPRDKTCGDGLTPRAIRQLSDMGFDFDVPTLHRITGLRAYAGDLKIELPWPEHTIYPNWGAVIRRADLDGQVALLAEKQGAVFHQNTAAAPIVEDGRLAGVELHRKDADGAVDIEVVTPRVVVIAGRFAGALRAQARHPAPQGLPLWARDPRLCGQPELAGSDAREPAEPSGQGRPRYAGVTAGSSRSGTGPSTWAWECCRASRLSKR